jgi:hypothetical protein
MIPEHKVTAPMIERFSAPVAIIIGSDIPQVFIFVPTIRKFPWRTT